MSELPGPRSPEEALRLVRERGRRRLRRRRLVMGAGGLVVVLALAAGTAVALRSSGSGHAVQVLGHGGPTVPSTPPASATPTTAPTSTTPAPIAGPPFACSGFDLWHATSGSPVDLAASSGTTRLTVTGTVQVPAGLPPFLAHPTVTVTDGGHTLVSEALTPPKTVPSVGPSGVMLQGIGPIQADPSRPSDQVCVARFSAGEVTALIGLYTGGAHCCTVVRAYDLPAGTSVELDMGNSGAVLSTDRGSVLLVGADNAFAYEFASFAASGLPIKVFSFASGAFVDVTRQHLGLVMADDTNWWNIFNRDPSNGLGVLAAWVADECVQGRSAHAWSTVDTLLAQGKLSGLSPWPSGTAYVQHLHSFLAQHGYCS